MDGENGIDVRSGRYILNKSSDWALTKKPDPEGVVYIYKGNYPLKFHIGPGAVKTRQFELFGNAPVTTVELVFVIKNCLQADSKNINEALDKISEQRALVASKLETWMALMKRACDPSVIATAKEDDQVKLFAEMSGVGKALIDLTNSLGLVDKVAAKEKEDSKRKRLRRS